MTAFKAFYSYWLLLFFILFYSVRSKSSVQHTTILQFIVDNSQNLSLKQKKGIDSESETRNIKIMD